MEAAGVPGPSRCGGAGLPQELEPRRSAATRHPADFRHDAQTVEDLKLTGSFSWGASVGFFFSPRLGVEASWARQQSRLELTTAEASAEMFDVTIDQIQGSFVYQFGGADARWRPFLCAGAGAAIFSPTDITSETKLALNVGAGLKWLPSKRLARGFQPSTSRPT